MSRFEMNGVVGRFWWIPILVIVAFIAGTLVGPGNPDAPATAVDKVPTRWMCSMHPQIILPSNDQQCPICFMDLIPLEENGSVDLAPEVLSLSPRAMALAEIACEPVRREFATSEIALVGKVTADETRLHRITARVAGRLDDLLVDTTGQRVAKDQPLARIYSPELYTAQMELHSAANALRVVGAQGGPALDRAETNLESSRERLRLWGLSSGQIQSIETGAEISDQLLVMSPTRGVVVELRAAEGDYVKTGSVLYAVADLSTVWVTFQALESDVAVLHNEQDVLFTTRAWPGRDFQGRIRFIDPILNEQSRTVEVRVGVPNTEGLLKPGMLVSGQVLVTLDRNADAVSPADIATAEPPLIIPATAPLLTGTRAIVYVRDPDASQPVFTGRQVRLGPRAGDYYLVLTGLNEGEQVVTRGNFKIDSALQILARPSLMNPLHDPAPLHLISRERVHPHLKVFLARYLDLQKALANGDDPQSRNAATGLVGVLSQADPDLNLEKPETRQAWVDQRTNLTTMAGKVAATASIADRRLAFEPLSDQLWRTLTAFSYASSEPVRRFHCPMAMNDAGVYWLQADKQIANPYYGDRMLRCGSQVAVRGGQGQQGVDHE